MFSNQLDKTGQTVLDWCMGKHHLRFCTHQQSCREFFLRQAKEHCEMGRKDTSFCWPPYHISCVPCACGTVILRTKARMMRSKGKCSGCCSTARDKKPRERKKQGETVGSEGSVEAQPEDVDALLSASFG
jgi:hypothetical protein